MPSLIQTIANIAETTFSKSRLDESFSTSLNELIQTVNTIQAFDVNINPSTVWNRKVENTAPIIGIPVFLNKKFSIDVLILQDGASLPLHDHPGMFGISKVLYGTLEYTAYNLILSTSDEPDFMIDYVETKTKNLKLKANSLIPVELLVCKDVTSKDESCLVTPVVGNYHEMRAVNGKTALLDIVAPPYDSEHPCHRYSLLESKGSDSQSKMWLCELTDMSKFWFNVFKYTGPKVSI